MTATTTDTAFRVTPTPRRARPHPRRRTRRFRQPARAGGRGGRWLAHALLPAEALIADIFADPTIEFIHTRNVYAGCYMFRIGRPGA